MASPFFDPRQVAGGGILGQGLLSQQQAIDAASSAPPATTLGAMASGDMAQVPPPPKIRPGFQLLDPKDWTPEEHALFRQMHNIQPPPTIWQQLMDLASRYGGMGQSAQAQQQPPQK